METEEIFFTLHIDTKNNQDHTISPEIACEYYKLICEYKKILADFGYELTTLPETPGGRKFNNIIKKVGEIGKKTFIAGGTIGAFTVGFFDITDGKTFQTFYKSYTQREWLDDIDKLGKFLRQKYKTYSKINKDGELLINNERQCYIENFNKYVLTDIDIDEDEEDIESKILDLKEPILIKSVKVGTKHINFVKTDKDILANRQEIIDFRNQKNREKFLNLFGVYE